MLLLAGKPSRYRVSALSRRCFFGSSYVSGTTPGTGSTAVKRKGTPLHGVYSPVEKIQSKYTHTIQKVLMCKYWGLEELITRGPNSLRNQRRPS